MSLTSIRRVSGRRAPLTVARLACVSVVSVLGALGVISVGACASGARDVSGITPFPEEPIDGTSREDAGYDAGSAMDSGTDATTMDASLDSGFDAGTSTDAGMGGVDGGQPRDCAADLPNACGNAASATYVVPTNGSVAIGGVVDIDGDDYFLVQFQGAGGPGTAFHPKIELTTNNGGTYSFSVQASCVSGVSCAPGSSIFEMTYPGLSQVCAGEGNCTDMVSRPAMVIVRVTRPPVYNCFQYTITASNMP